MSEPIDQARPGVVTLEVLSHDTCLGLLATAHVGRIGLMVDGRPEILPVNYAQDGDTVLFRTAEGSVLTQVSLSEVAFEVDHFDEEMRAGWSVLVQGNAQDIGDAIDSTSQRLRHLALISWAPGQRDRWFAVYPHKITGRRLRVMPAEL